MQGFLNVLLLSSILALILVLYYKVFSPDRRARIEVTRVQLSDDGKVVDINYLVRKPGRIVGSPATVFLFDELKAKKVKACPAPEETNVIDIDSKRRVSGSIQLTNEHNVLKRGSFVTVNIGDYRREHLIVV